MPSLNTFKLTLTRPSAVSVSLLENCGVGVSGALNVVLLSVTLMYVESKLERPYSVVYRVSADGRSHVLRRWARTHRAGVLYERV